MKFLEARVLAYDMIAPFNVPYFIYEYTTDIEYWYVNRAATVVTIYKHCSEISLKQEILFWRDSYDYCVDDEDVVSCEWTLKLFVNSFDGAFIKSIAEKYKTLYELEQGEIKY